MPSPAFVGVIAVTQTSFASGCRRQPVEHRQPDLRLVVSVELDLVRLEADLRRDVRDRPELRGLGDLEAREHDGIIPSRGRRDTMKRR